MAFDSTRKVAVLFGGRNHEDQPFRDTWEWDGDQWRLVSQIGPTLSIFHAMAYDAHRKQTVLVDGTGGGRTWEWNGAEWNLRPGDTPVRYSYAMVYDSDRRQCVMFGGTNGSEPVSDTWAWNGSQWSKVLTDSWPAARYKHAMAYDAAHHAVVLFGGKTLEDPFGDAWELACTGECYADFNKDGVLDLFDFLAFVNLFNAGDPAADCIEDGTLDQFDFLCFVNAFNGAC